MAKRKDKNKSFASKKAAESQANQRVARLKSLVRNGAIGLVALSVVGFGLFFLVQYINTTQPEPEPAAVESDLGSVETGTVADTVDETVPVDEVSVPQADPTGTLMVTERPLAEISPIERNGYYSAPPEMTIDPSKSYQAILVTDQGEMLIQLFADKAPITVNNFVFLANQGFYDDLIFHRVLENFMVQGGDPAGIGSGGPGYNFEDEFDSSLQFDQRGLLAMANSGPATNGSQFFITHVPTDWLTGAHTIFGELISGDDTLGAIPISGQAGSPAQLIRVDIYEN
ncbi:MAG: cyclophilin family peptidyl-prolyl cis-trans isomerase [Cellvibrionaceae bacterium]|jgi:cyclophilin family peptidyl-prolyl cis-trans isomerase